MAWEDRTPFEAIELQFGLREAQVIALMRSHLKLSSFKLWRLRVTGRRTKHASRRPAEMKDSGRHTACLGQPARHR
ncbi:TIGR03643 family protein [Zwartia panacis]|uniref:TIGR03643 family protein n=1 Tax=Zwartia panacis TaxID=2683345 RepID=UPI0025B4D66A|nr:TIGR03643 family protein [Zwartia panacis]MDN4016329.1 TIGR03643 family protein [Zwartia panacis]